MARERWFYAQGNQRRGPVLFNQLVESVLGQAEPRTVLVWRKGFADWTRAEDVPEVERRLAPFLARKAAEEAAKRGPAPAPVEAQPARPVRVEEVKPGSPMLVYGGIAAGVARARAPGVAVLAPRRAARPCPDGAAARRHDHRQLAGGGDPGAPARDTRGGGPDADASARHPSHPHADAGRGGRGAVGPRGRSRRGRPQAAAGGRHVGGRHAQAHRLQRHDLARDRALREDQPLQGRRLRRGPARRGPGSARRVRGRKASRTC